MSTWDRDRKQRAHYTASCPPLVSDTNKTSVTLRRVPTRHPSKHTNGGQCDSTNLASSSVMNSVMKSCRKPRLAQCVEGKPRRHISALRTRASGPRRTRGSQHTGWASRVPGPQPWWIVLREDEYRPHTLTPFRKESLTLSAISPSQSYLVLRRYPVLLGSFRKETRSNRPHTKTPSLSLSFSCPPLLQK
jgi:hypothetical protein